MTFLDDAVNKPQDTPLKRPRGRPRNKERGIQWVIVLPESISDQLDKLQGVYGKTRSSVLQAIVQQYLAALGPEGIAALKKANRYGQLIEKRKIEQRAKDAFHTLMKETLVRRSGGWMDGDGNELMKNE